jgi:hypothetical protein
MDGVIQPDDQARKNHLELIRNEFFETHVQGVTSVMGVPVPYKVEGYRVWGSLYTRRINI